MFHLVAACNSATSYGYIKVLYSMRLNGHLNTVDMTGTGSPRNQKEVIPSTAPEQPFLTWGGQRRGLLYTNQMLGLQLLLLFYVFTKMLP